MDKIYTPEELSERKHRAKHKTTIRPSAGRLQNFPPRISLTPATIDHNLLLSFLHCQGRHHSWSLAEWQEHYVAQQQSPAMGTKYPTECTFHLDICIRFTVFPLSRAINCGNSIKSETAAVEKFHQAYVSRRNYIHVGTAAAFPKRHVGLQTNFHCCCVPEMCNRNGQPEAVRCFPWVVSHQGPRGPGM